MKDNYPENLEISMPVNVLLEMAERCFSYDKTPLALGLLHLVLEKFPDHPRALQLYKMMSNSVYKRS